MQVRSLEQEASKEIDAALGRLETNKPLLYKLICILGRLFEKLHSFLFLFNFCQTSPSLPRREVGLLKELWDMINLVESSMAAWRTTPWREINVEEMELQCKRFSREIRSLDKEVRGGARKKVAQGQVNSLEMSLGMPTSLNNSDLSHSCIWQRAQIQGSVMGGR